MKKLLIKLISKIRNFRKFKIDALNVEERSRRTVSLRLNNKSDFDRWNLDEELFSDWNERTAIIGNYIMPDSNIIEFGAGNMFLKSFLTNYKSYTPSDLVKRFDETVVCDLNDEINIDFSKYEVVVFSGVLEYVYDINKVFNSMSKNSNQVVMSYCCSDLVKLSRDKNGWLSDYSKTELEEIFNLNGYSIIDYTEWRNQSIYNLMKDNAV